MNKLYRLLRTHYKPSKSVEASHNENLAQICKDIRSRVLNNPSASEYSEHHVEDLNWVIEEVLHPESIYPTRIPYSPTKD